MTDKNLTTLFKASRQTGKTFTTIQQMFVELSRVAGRELTEEDKDYISQLNESLIEEENQRFRDIWTHNLVMEREEGDW